MATIKVEMGFQVNHVAAARTAADDLLRQSQLARELGSPFIADVLGAAARNLHLAPQVKAILDSWPSDRLSSAAALRLNAGLHHVARIGSVPALSAAYARLDGNCEHAVAQAMRQCDTMLTGWLARPTQTNEIARSAAIMAALRLVAMRDGNAIDLLELGASAGLNLNLARYSHDLGGISAGDPASPVIIRPQWFGKAPAGTPARIIRARGVDLAPPDANDPDDCERLLAFIWADQRDRLERQRQAIMLARLHPVDVVRHDAIDWLRASLASPGMDGVCRTVVHTMFHQYLPQDRRSALSEILEAAGAASTARSPLACIALEWDSARHEVELILTTWPGGHRAKLAVVHPYGAWIRWLGP
ncbi:DUF2332 domain-containing protein [Novosphingobium percolationis]|uniref:DUF2332 domain-containing protein n=1 Tax=Novosphingobium percolationis TaxID=2871811 RepID=UPI001CD56376|nr:DUF2332 family protein [Novosphingobium percolationis]